MAGKEQVVDRATVSRAVMEERTTVHDYAPTAVDIAAINRALSVALTAPNHRMTEPWRFVVVGPQAREFLAELSVELKAKKGPLDPSTAQAVRAKVLNPAWLIVVSQVKNANLEVAREDYAAMACAIQNLMLSLHAEGIGSKWSTGAVISHPRTYAHLGIGSEQEEIVGFIWAGIAAKPPLKVARKRGLNSVVRYLP